MRLLLILAFVQLAACTAFANRVEYVATFAGERLKGSEVCFFSAAADDGFFQKFLSSSDVRCFDADAVIQMPLGYWNIFVNHRDSYTSTHPTIQLSDYQTEAQQRAFGTLPVDMRPAALLRVSPPRQHVRPVVYFPNLNNPDEPATIRLPVTGRSHVLVPTGTPVVPLVVSGVRIVQIGEIVQLGHGETGTATFTPLPDQRRHVVALLRVAGSVEDGDELLDALDVRLESGNEVLTPLVPMRSGRALDRSLLIFRNAPMAEATIVIGGRRWKPQRVHLPAGTDAVEELKTIVVERVSEIEAAWTLPSVEPTTPCRLTPARPTPAQLTLERCSSADTCAPVQTADLGPDVSEGQETFTGLEPGTYRVTLKHDRLGTVTREVLASPGKTAQVMLALQPIRISGAVTSKDRPVLADVEFLTGETSTDMHGRYVALLPRSPGLETVTVHPCDGMPPYTAIPAHALDDGATFDIVIPSTEVRVQVVERGSGKSLAEAGVDVAVLFGPDEIERYYLEAPRTDPAGKTAFHRVPPDAWIRVCASRKGHVSECTAALQLKQDEQRAVRLELQPEQLLTGRIVADAPVRSGTIFWMSPSGTVTERRPVAADGSFFYAPGHSSQEYLVFVAHQFSLHVLSAPAAGSLELTLPARPVRTLLLNPGPIRNARIALEVDGRLVPEEVFAQHQIINGRPAAIHDGQAVPVAPMAVHEIVVLVGPPTNFVPPNAPPSNDLSSVPQFRAMFRRVRATGATVDLQD